jgi:putative membrane protein
VEIGLGERTEELLRDRGQLRPGEGRRHGRHDTPIAADPGYAAPVFPHLGAFLVRLGLSALVLMLAVGWVSPRNPSNTFGRALLVSFVLSLAWYITLARFLWVLLLPWLLYAGIWLLVVMGSYRLTFGRSLLMALALSLLSWVVSLLFDLHTF